MSWGTNYGKTERIDGPNDEDWKIYKAGKKAASDRIKPCDKCGEEIFFAKNGNNKWLPFNAEVSEVIPPNTTYCDGYDHVKRTGDKPGKKEYIIHFDTCGK